jgi:hypothetical protein
MSATDFGVPARIEVERAATPQQVALIGAAFSDRGIDAEVLPVAFDKVFNGLPRTRIETDVPAFLRAVRERGTGGLRALCEEIDRIPGRGRETSADLDRSSAVGLPGTIELVDRDGSVALVMPQRSIDDAFEQVEEDPTRWRGVGAMAYHRRRGRWVTFDEWRREPDPSDDTGLGPDDLIAQGWQMLGADTARDSEPNGGHIGASQTRIAGEYTCEEWQALSARLDKDGRPPVGLADGIGPDWRKAIEVIRTRLYGRYVQPLDALRRAAYAGFLVVAIDSLLVEAIERVRQGRRLEEGASSELVSTFLRERSTFGGVFRQEVHRRPFRTCLCIACDFYRGVRSAIAHEGETQNGWTIRVGRSELLHVQGDEKVLDRNRFHEAVVTEFYSYLDELERLDADRLRAHLKRTLDEICGALPLAKRRPRKAHRRPAQGIRPV